MKTIDEMLEGGTRAFDLRVGFDEKSKDHAGTPTKLSWWWIHHHFFMFYIDMHSLYTRLGGWCDTHPNEIIYLRVKCEPQDSTSNAHKKENLKKIADACAELAKLLMPASAPAEPKPRSYLQDAYFLRRHASSTNLGDVAVSELLDRTTDGRNPNKCVIIPAYERADTWDGGGQATVVQTQWWDWLDSKWGDYANRRHLEKVATSMFSQATEWTQKKQAPLPKAECFGPPRATCNAGEMRCNSTEAEDCFVNHLSLFTNMDTGSGGVSGDQSVTLAEFKASTTLPGLPAGYDEDCLLEKMFNSLDDGSVDKLNTGASGSLDFLEFSEEADCLEVIERLCPEIPPPQMLKPCYTVTVDAATNKRTSAEVTTYRKDEPWDLERYGDFVLKASKVAFTVMVEEHDACASTTTNGRRKLPALPWKKDKAQAIRAEQDAYKPDRPLGEVGRKPLSSHLHFTNVQAFMSGKDRSEGLGMKSIRHFSRVELYKLANDPDRLKQVRFAIWHATFFWSDFNTDETFWCALPNPATYVKGQVKLHEQPAFAACPAGVIFFGNPEPTFVHAHKYKYRIIEQMAPYISACRVYGEQCWRDSHLANFQEFGFHKLKHEKTDDFVAQFLDLGPGNKKPLGFWMTRLFELGDEFYCMRFHQLFIPFAQ